MSVLNVTHQKGEIGSDEGFGVGRVCWDNKFKEGDILSAGPDTCVSVAKILLGENGRSKGGVGIDHFCEKAAEDPPDLKGTNGHAAAHAGIDTTVGVVINYPSPPSFLGNYYNVARSEFG